MTNTLTEHIARSTMELKDVNMCLSFISTIWRDKPIMLVWDNINCSIVSTWFDPEFQVGDVTLIESLIIDFLD